MSVWPQGQAVPAPDRRAAFSDVLGAGSGQTSRFSRFGSVCVCTLGVLGRGPCLSMGLTCVPRTPSVPAWVVFHGIFSVSVIWPSHEPGCGISHLGTTLGSQRCGFGVFKLGCSSCSQRLIDMGRVGEIPILQHWVTAREGGKVCGPGEGHGAVCPVPTASRTLATLPK